MWDVRPQAFLTLVPVALFGVAMAFAAGDETSAGPEQARIAKQATAVKKSGTPPPVRLLNPFHSRVQQSSIGAQYDLSSLTTQDEEEPSEIVVAKPSKAVRFRTWCVRLCDGYYYPMNYLTTRGRLQADDEKCRSRCSSESRLFVNAVVGRKASPMVDLSGLQYRELPTAFAYRREINAACTCDGSRMEITSSTLGDGP